MSCLVCLKPFRDKRRVWTLDCEHEFHSDCVMHRRRCPICMLQISPQERKIIFAQYRRVPVDRYDSGYESDDDLR